MITIEKKHKIKRFIIALLILILVATGMYFVIKYGSNFSIKPDYSGTITDTSDCANITFDKENISLENTDAKVYGSTLKITSGGTYNLTGSLTGNIYIDVGSENEVTLILNNVTISSSNTSAIYVESAKNTYIVAKENTKNYLSDSTKYTNQIDGEPDACVFSKDDLIIKGTGYIEINGNYMDGIVSKDDLKIENASLKVVASDDAIRGKDSVIISNSTLTISAESDGIKATNDTENNKGIITITDSKLNITSKTDGIQSEKELVISGSEIEIKTASGSSVTSQSSSWGNFGNESNKNSEDTSSAKGIKSTKSISISDSKITVDSTDDSIHSNGTIEIKSGTYNLSSGDDGIHADTSITIESGTINVTKSYEAIESDTITINNGNINVVASDDGINSSGGVDSSSQGGRPGQNNFTTGTGKLTINGGTIIVNAAGDGIDINGSIYMTGGVVTVYGPVSSGNGALDYDSTFKITGGEVIAGGSIGMAQTPSESSSINSVSISFTSTIQSSKTVYIKDSNGNNIFTYKSTKEFQNIVIASNKLVKQSKYSIYIGDELYKTFTISGVITTVGTNGNSMSPRR